MALKFNYEWIGSESPKVVLDWIVDRGEAGFRLVKFSDSDPTWFTAIVEKGNWKDDDETDPPTLLQDS